MKAGPKAAIDTSGLPFRPRSAGAARFGKSCERFIVVPKGAGALSTLRLRPWQLELAGSVLDSDPAPRTAGWMMPRGQGKSTLVAALGLYNLFEGGEGATVCVVAVDERQAGIVFNIARRMIELHDDLADRCQVFKEKLIIPARDAQFHCLPAEPKRLEGLDYTLAIVDEAGRVDTEVFEVVTLATGKQKASMVLAIGTPGPELAATALGDFLAIDGLEACLPPKMREASFRRARLCQLTDQLEAAWLPPSAWAACADVNQPVVDGAEVVLAFDGSFNGDTTVLVVASVAERPHVDLVELWEPPAARSRSSTLSRRSHRRAGAGRCWRSPPTRSAGHAPSTAGRRRVAGHGVPAVTRAHDPGHRPVL